MKNNSFTVRSEPEKQIEINVSESQLPALHPSQFPTLVPTTESISDNFVPMVGNLKKRVPTFLNAEQQYMMLHLLFQHSSKSYIEMMCDSKCYDDLPKSHIFRNINCTCWI